MSEPLKKVSAFDSAPRGPREPGSRGTSHPAAGGERGGLRTTCDEPPRGKNMSAMTTRGRAMRWLKLAVEHDRAGDRPAAEQRDPVLVTRPVVQRAAGDK